jgi:GT2 family glycosyltransferase
MTLTDPAEAQMPSSDPGLATLGNGVDVSIIIVNWNAMTYLRNCLRSIAQETRVCTYEVIVVDNDSDDGSQEMIRAEFPDVTAVLNERNVGFAGGNNQAMRMARGRYILLLNPDTLVLNGAVDTCVAYADELRDERVGVLGCQVWEDEATIQKTCFQFPSPLNTLLTLLGLTRRFPRSRFLSRSEMRWWDRRSEREVDVVSGMFMLVRRDAVEEVGLMDEGYFMYAEEADWCYRFWRSGWRCLFTPRARIMHLEGGGKSSALVSAKMSVHLQKSVLRFHRKNRGRVAWALAQGMYAVLMPIRAVAFGLLALVGRSERWRAKYRQAAAATRYHLLRIEPQL